MKLGPNQQTLVVALRSGMYRQGRNYLEDDGRMCCLGVASSLAGCERKIGPTKLITYDDEIFLSPPRVVEFLALKTKDGYIPSIGKSLAGLNDNCHNFKEIADIIEQYAEELFSEAK